MSKLRDTRADETGAVFVLTVLAMAIVMGFAALVVDLGNVRQESTQAQTSADSGALYGAQVAAQLTFPAGWPTLVGDVKNAVKENLEVAASAWSGCHDSGALGYAPDSANNDTCISTNSSTNPSELRVTVPSVATSSNFTHAAGQQAISVRATAVAALPHGAACVICLLGTTGVDLSVTGAGGTVSVTNAGSGAPAGIVVDSSAQNALSLNGAGNTLQGQPIDVHGGYQLSGAGNQILPSNPVTGTASIANPLANLPAPGGVASPSTAASCSGGAGGHTWTASVSGDSLTVNGAGISCTVYPGLYTTISVTGAGDTLTMSSGLYVFSRGISAVGAGITVNATDVTMYFACSNYASGGSCGSSGQAGAVFSGTGAGVTYTFSPPASGTYQGVSIFYDPHNTSGLTVTGAGNSTLTGTIYAASSDLSMTGAGNGTNFGVDSMVVVAQATLTGAGGALNDVYNSASNASAPSGLAYLIG